MPTKMMMTRPKLQTCSRLPADHPRRALQHQALRLLNTCPFMLHQDYPRLQSRDNQMGSLPVQRGPCPIPAQNRTKRRNNAVVRRRIGIPTCLGARETVYTSRHESRRPNRHRGAFPVRAVVRRPRHHWDRPIRELCIWVVTLGGSPV